MQLTNSQEAKEELKNTWYKSYSMQILFFFCQFYHVSFLFFAFLNSISEYSALRKAHSAMIILFLLAQLLSDF